MNLLAEYHELFAASAGSAAALIGLLFVAISIAPERTFGENADTLRRAHAERAFTALGNVFFVSLAALLPRSALGAIAVVAFIAVAQTVRVGIAGLRSPQEERSWREFGLTSLFIYAFEFALAKSFIPGVDLPETLVWVIFGLYSYAIGTAWSLMGGHASGKAR